MQISKSSRTTRTLAAAVASTLLIQLAPFGTEAAPEPAAVRVAWQAGPLRSDAYCAARVQPRKEIRPENRRFNRAGAQPRVRVRPFRRVTGNFTGTTDEIIQWAACKWGFRARVLRAQVAKESWWYQSALGDWTSDPRLCAPGHGIGADGEPGQCPESVGLMQVRTQYFRRVIVGSVRSSAYNLDVALAVWRSCWAGKETWLNDVEHGRVYRAGDEWGCIGRWFSGRWYTQPAVTYIRGVKDYYRRRVWAAPGF
jgi:hypothetical protein